MAYIELNDVYKKYHSGDVVIEANRNINFKIKKGELVVILGSSGAGKSTLLNILGGMDTADQGQVIIDGLDINTFNDKEKTIYCQAPNKTDSSKKTHFHSKVCLPIFNRSHAF